MEIWRCHFVVSPYIITSFATNHPECWSKARELRWCKKNCSHLLRLMVPAVPDTQIHTIPSLALTFNSANGTFQHVLLCFSVLFVTLMPRRLWAVPLRIKGYGTLLARLFHFGVFCHLYRKMLLRNFCNCVTFCWQREKQQWGHRWHSVGSITRHWTRWRW